MLLALRIIAMAFSLVLAGFMVVMGHPSNASWWLLAVPTFAGDVSPLVAAYIIARKSVRPELAAFMLLAGLGYAVIASAAIYGAFFPDPDGASGFVFFALPVMGWFGLLIATLCAAVLIAVRSRVFRH
jgi:hypothetical protein